MRRWLFCYALVPLALLNAPRAGARLQSTTQAMIDGQVIDADTGTPIPRTRVWLVSPLDDDPITVIADADGRFHFGALEAKAGYRIMAEKPLYMGPGGSPNSSAHLIQLDLTRPPNAPISAPFKDGTTPIPNIVTGSMASRPLNLTKVVDKAGTVHAFAELRLRRYGAITGRVTTPEAQPLSGRLVSLLEKVPLSPGQTNMPGMAMSADGTSYYNSIANQEEVDDRGEFRIARLAPGTYIASIGTYGTPPGWNSTYRETYYGGTIDRAQAKEIVIAPGTETRADIAVIAQRGVRMSGRLDYGAVADPSQFWTMVNVRSENPGGVQAPNATTLDRDNRGYTTENLLPGRYVIYVKVQRKPTNESLDYGTPLMGGVRSVEVGGSDATGVDVELKPATELKGVVTFAPGCARVPVEVMLREATYVVERPGVKVASEDGRFVIAGVVPGLVNVNVQPMDVAAGYWMTARRLNGEVARDHSFFVLKSPGEDSLEVVMGCTPGRQLQ